MMLDMMLDVMLDQMIINITNNVISLIVPHLAHGRFSRMTDRPSSACLHWQCVGHLVRGEPFPLLCLQTLLAF